ncbi:GntR family transcriptional regulator [Roseivivax sediminis]|uniref:DNA-binding transcriptional regulator, GntR family n=1 Tax=Roseivivax sediminis TaxID=936889 RepID=A0A1I1ZKL9_9RHOB|nr:GntR family transcriptional regulator [Roseivivax sediminis]SFE32374.1 DNA-binding transcriptional regulator, GntR family [Roseivivax sediminis]
MARSEKARIEEDLKARILTGDLRPGATLEEARLCGDYGLSRTPLREIFQRLGGAGFLVLGAGRAPNVAQLDLVGYRSLLRSAPLLIAALARQAAEEHSTADLAALREVQAAFGAAVSGEDAETAALADHRFHEAVAAMAGNPFLAPGHTRMMIEVTRLTAGFYAPQAKKDRKQLKRAAAQHDELVQALAARDGVSAAALALQHWDLTREGLDRAMRPDPLPADL